MMQQLLADDDVSAMDYMWGFFGDWDRSQLMRTRRCQRAATPAST